MSDLMRIVRKAKVLPSCPAGTPLEHLVLNYQVRTHPWRLVPPTSLTLAQNGGNPVVCAVGDTAYVFDGRTMSSAQIDDPRLFVNQMDACDVAVGAIQFFQTAGMIPADATVQVAAQGMTLSNVVAVGVNVVHKKQGGWFDSTFVNGKNGHMVWYNRRTCPLHPCVKHTGDNPAGYRIPEGTNHQGMFLEGGVCEAIFTVIGFSGAKLAQFADQYNVIRVTLEPSPSVQEVVWLCVPWDLTPAKITDSRVAGVFATTPNRDGRTMTLTVNFQTFEKEPFSFEPGDQTDIVRRFANKYLEDTLRSVPGTSLAGVVPSRDNDGPPQMVDTTHVPKFGSCLVVHGDVPDELSALAASLGMQTTPLFPGIFGARTEHEGSPGPAGNGLAHLAFSGGPIATEFSVIYVEGDLPQEYKKLVAQQRCVIVLRVENGLDGIGKANLYPVWFATPQSTVVVYDPDLGKFYKLFGPVPSVRADDSIDLEELCRFHLENPANFPLRTDGLVYLENGEVLPPDQVVADPELASRTDLLEQVRMLASPESWTETFDSLVKRLNAAQQESRKEYRRLYARIESLKAESGGRRNKGRKALVDADIALLKETLAKLRAAIKNGKELAENLLKLEVHPRAAKSLDAYKQLGNLQGKLRNKASGDLKERVGAMLKDHGTFLAEIEPILDVLEGDTGILCVAVGSGTGGHESDMFCANVSEVFTAETVSGAITFDTLDALTMACCIEQGGEDGSLETTIRGERVIGIPTGVIEGDLGNMYMNNHQLYVYLALLAATKFCRPGQNFFDAEPLQRLADFLMRVHDQYAAMLTSHYTADRESTTTKTLMALRYLVLAVWCGFRDGRFQPELARYGGHIPAGKIPTNREQLSAYDVTAALWYGRSIQLTATSPNEWQSFLKRLWGDLCRTIWLLYVQPLLERLKAEKAKAVHKIEMARNDANETRLRLQLLWCCRLCFPAMDYEMAIEALFGVREEPQVDLQSRSRRGHFISSQWLKRTVEAMLARAGGEISDAELPRLVQTFVRRSHCMLPEKPRQEFHANWTQKGQKGVLKKMRAVLMMYLHNGTHVSPEILEASGFRLPQPGKPFPFFSTGKKTGLKELDKPRLLEAIKAKSSPGGGARTATAAPVEEVTRLTPQQELEAAGVPPELAVRIGESSVITQMPGVAPLLEDPKLGLTLEAIHEITFIVLMHWENPDAGMRVVTNMLEAKLASELAIRVD